MHRTLAPQTDLSPIVPFKKLPNTKAWKLTSEYVRKVSGGTCYTCGKRYPYSKLVAGHFIEKIGSGAIYFDLRGLRAQCNFNCNRMAHGNKAIYAAKLIEEYQDGGQTILDLRKLCYKPKLWRKNELHLIEVALTEKLKQFSLDRLSPPI